MRPLAVALLAVVAVLGLAPPADAHASLVRTDPAEGAVLASAPEQIRFTFSEAVAAVPDSVQVFDAAGESVDATTSVRDAVLEATLDEAVGDGTLVVVWRVLSEDGHPVSGSLSFSVGAPSPSVQAPPVTAADTDDAPVLLSVVRWVGYAGLLATSGLVVFALLFLPRHRDAATSRQRLVSATRLGAAVAGLAWLVGLPLTVVYQVGGDAGSLGDGSAWSALSTTEYAVPAAVVAGLLVAVAMLGNGEPTRARGAGVLGAVVVAGCAPALTGHTRAETPEWLVVAVDMLHLAAGSVWLGGLVALLLVLSDLAGRGTLAGETLARFSTVAAGLVAVLVATGSVLAWRIVGSWSGLFETAYGQLLLVKIAIAAAAVAFAAWNRFRLLPAMRQAPRRRERRDRATIVVRTAAAEAVALVGLLLVTGMLVDRSPEDDPSAAAAGTATVVGRLGGIELEATVAPAVTGPSNVTLTMTDATGEPFEGFEAPRARLEAGEVDLGAIELRNIGPGAYAADVVFPSPGTWELQVSLRVSEFENPVTTLEIPVGSAG
ncbi:CopD family protein [Nocardioides thalensis]|nr:copper resistance protein CopC [Nocardioides thalensis]